MPKRCLQWLPPALASLLLAAAGCQATDTWLSTHRVSEPGSLGRGEFAPLQPTAAHAPTGSILLVAAETQATPDAEEILLDETLPTVDRTPPPSLPSPPPSLPSSPAADDPDATLRPELTESGQLLPGTQPLDLSTILFLADARNPNIAAARERINEAYARVDRAEVLWLPSLRAGLNYSRHDGRIQDVEGNIIETNRNNFYGGLGAGAIAGGNPTIHGIAAQFHLADAIFQPKITGYEAASTRAAATAVRNDTVRDAAVAYLELVRAEHALAIADEALKNTQTLSEVTSNFARTGQGTNADQERLLAELSTREYEVLRATELVETNSARLAQLLHAEVGLKLTSCEPVVAPLDVCGAADRDATPFVAMGLSHRPELVEQRNLVGAAIERMNREKYAPLVPSVLLGTSTGAMAGGKGTDIGDSDDRWDADLLAYWEIRNLGFGEAAARRETASAIRQNRARQVALLDQVAREVTTAHSQVIRRRDRIELARRGVAAATQSYEYNGDRIRNLQGLPIEALQSVQALANARRNYLDAVVDYNVAQFELCRATGQFVSGVAETSTSVPPAPAPPGPVPPAPAPES